MKFVAALILLAALAPAGCKGWFEAPQPKDYDSPAMRFTYPGNFKLNANTEIEGAEQVTLEAGDNQIVIITVFKKKTGNSAEDFGNMIAEEREKNVDETLSIGGVKFSEQSRADFEPFTLAAGKRKLTGVSEKFNIKLASIDVPHRAAYFTEQRGAQEVMYVVQSPEKDWNKLQAVFTAIAATLKTRPW